MAQYVCTKCGYVYDESVGDTAHGFPAGTRFFDLPETWVCPRCKVSKSHFIKK
ncbi:MAG: rubredoxin [Methanospirillaceae archaeon]|nr:rubredoxin [Methanospirillaceae archaeon]